MPAQREPRVVTIEGRRALVIERQPPIAPTLHLLLEGGRGPDGHLWKPLRLIARHTLRTGGASRSCSDQDHRLQPWLEGFSLGSDGVTRLLRLLNCQDCAATCVRDISIDDLAGLPHAGPAKHRDHVIAWYTGARPRGRVYTHMGRASIA